METSKMQNLWQYVKHVEIYSATIHDLKREVLIGLGSLQKKS